LDFENLICIAASANKTILDIVQLRFNLFNVICFQTTWHALFLGS